MKVLDFGKFEGTQLSNCPEKYIIWLAQHERVLAERNRWASRDAKFLLEKKEAKMLNAVRSEYCGEFDWQESLKDTVLANREATFTVDEMYAALESICKAGDDQLDSKERVARRLEGLSQRTCQIKLEKLAEQTYKFAYVG